MTPVKLSDGELKLIINALHRSIDWETQHPSAREPFGVIKLVWLGADGLSRQRRYLADRAKSRSMAHLVDGCGKKEGEEDGN